MVILVELTIIKFNPKNPNSMEVILLRGKALSRHALEHFSLINTYKQISMKNIENKILSM